MSILRSLMIFSSSNSSKEKLNMSLNHMAETTLRSKKQIYYRRRPALKVVSDVSVVTPPIVKIEKDLKADHKFFINSLFCEMIEKI